MKTVATITAAQRCDELLSKLPGRSQYLEACRDYYSKAGGAERVSNLDAVLRAAARDTLPQGAESPRGASQRRSLKGSHRITLPGVAGPIPTAAWRHFRVISFPPDYSLVEVTTPDRIVYTVEVAETRLRPTGPPVLTAVCFGHPAKVDEWIQAQRGRHAEAKTTADLWEYYRSCGIEAGPAACAAVGRPPATAQCIRCRALIGPSGCVTAGCLDCDSSWLTAPLAPLRSREIPSTPC